MVLNDFRNNSGNATVNSLNDSNFNSNPLPYSPLPTIASTFPSYIKFVYMIFKYVYINTYILILQLKEKKN